MSRDKHLETPLEFIGVGHDREKFMDFLDRNPSYQILLEGIFQGVGRDSLAQGATRETLEFALALRSIIKEWEMHQEYVREKLEALRALEHAITRKG